MHAIEGTGSIPQFLTKLWRLVDDHRTNNLISWTQNGNSFVIRNQALFARELLPQYYKHNNMASFVRQLNMYGFHKVVSPDSGGLRVERDEMEFAHPHFLKGQEDRIENIKRKQQRRLLVGVDGTDFPQIPTTRVAVGNPEENQNVSKLLTEVRTLKTDQDTMGSKLLGLKRENEALWREYANMRQKFTKQQQIIEKLIHFLVAFSKIPSNQVNVKRKFGHLALEGGEETQASVAKLKQVATTLTQPIEMEGGTSSGAVIHEVTDMLEADEAESVETSGSRVFSLQPNNSNTSNNVYEPSVLMAEENTGPSLRELDTNNLSPGSIFLLKQEPQNVSTSVTNATSVMSPNGTLLTSSCSSSGSGSDFDLDMGQGVVQNLFMDEEEDPLSPELMDTVNPSAISAFPYPTNTKPLVYTSSNISGGPIIGGRVLNRSKSILHTNSNSVNPTNSSTVSVISPTTKILTSQMQQPKIIKSELSNSGKLRSIKAENIASAQPIRTQNITFSGSTANVQPIRTQTFSLSGKKANVQPIRTQNIGLSGSTANAQPIRTQSISTSTSNTAVQPISTVAVPEKNLVYDPNAEGNKFLKNPVADQQELQNHVDNFQSSIDSLQDLIQNGSLGIEPSLLLSMFNNDDNYLPDLDSLNTSGSGEIMGNEMSVYNPSLLDLSDPEDDPLSMLYNSINTGHSQQPSSSSLGPTPSKQLRLSIKKEPTESLNTDEEDDPDEMLQTPRIHTATSPQHIVFRTKGKKRGKN